MINIIDYLYNIFHIIKIYTIKGIDIDLNASNHCIKHKITKIML